MAGVRVRVRVRVRARVAPVHIAAEDAHAPPARKAHALVVPDRNE